MLAHALEEWKYVSGKIFFKFKNYSYVIKTLVTNVSKTVSPWFINIASQDRSIQTIPYIIPWYVLCAGGSPKQGNAVTNKFVIGPSGVCAPAQRSGH